MTFDRSEAIQFGDWVIVYHSRTQLTSEIVTRDKELQSRFGHFRHSDMVGKPWGTKLSSSNGRGFVFLLKPTPELWTQALPHRTQILYLPDIAFITSFLDVKAGSRVIEAGTGSGSFSHSLARTVGDQGKVHSFEYHEERFEKAKVEFKEHGLDGVITVKHRDVYKDGFELENEVDAIFLDLPAPWEALEHAKKAMRRDRQARICCFSPCIEQVIRTCSALAELGFSDITMYETLTRTHDPTPIVAPDVGTAIARIEEVENKKERRREGQIMDAARRREEKKRQREAEAAAAEAAEGTAAGAGSVAEADGTTPAPLDAASEPPAAPAVDKTAEGRRLRDERDRDRDFGTKAGAYTRGHTSFLTFAVLLPLVDGISQRHAPSAAAETAELAPLPVDASTEPSA
ncbi:tRNA methyltransferase complex GCD14 subunit [Rhodotorula sp. JG-1b]|nr:tRNA methyltransferase complex GCD14 subunit [Rhodotorula sp. JG-1b]